MKISHIFLMTAAGLGVAGWVGFANYLIDNPKVAREGALILRDYMISNTRFLSGSSKPKRMPSM